MSADTDLVTTPLTGELLRCALEVEDGEHGLVMHRLPADARARADAQLLGAESQPAGVRLDVRTAATTIELDAVRTTTAFRDVARRPDSRYDLLVDGVETGHQPSTGGTTVVVDPATGALERESGPTATVRFSGLPARDKRVEIWLPHYERIELVALRTDAPVRPTTDRDRPVWLHHGSSISQGSNAVAPARTWPALVARRAEVDLVNLGFSGSAMLDPFVARAIRDQPADLLSVAIGINLVNGDVMRLRAFTPAVHGFLDTLRDGHPTTPLVVVSPILCPIQEDTPGPLALDVADGALRFRATGDPAEAGAGRLTLQAVRAELARIVEERAATDPHLHLVDGLTLYGEHDAEEEPLPDRLHPAPATHELIAQRFHDQTFAAARPFARRG